VFYNEGVGEVRRLLFDYLRSPSLRHLRDPHSIDRLMEQIVGAIRREPSLWRKWEGEREALLKGAALCWVPAEDLCDFLNAMPGPPLTLTDVVQRLRALHEEPYASYPDEELKGGCLVVYQRERAEGTELPAIIGALQEYVEQEEDRLRRDREEARRKRQEEERLALEQRFLAGADCKWTVIQKSRHLYSRRNGRGYRLSPTKDKRWELFRVEGTEEGQRSALTATAAM
jgi:hypothetical protein